MPPTDEPAARRLAGSVGSQWQSHVFLIEDLLSDAMASDPGVERGKASPTTRDSRRFVITPLAAPATSSAGPASAPPPSLPALQQGARQMHGRRRLDRQRCGKTIHALTDRSQPRS